MCGQVDGGFDLQLPSRTDVAEALGMLNERGAAPLTAATPLTLKQKELTTCTDKVAWERRLANSSITAQAILRSEAEPGARAFLAAVPAGRKRMEPAMFVAELRQRLCMPDASRDVWCPRCDGILEQICPAGGERTLRHHALWVWTERAGMQPEREKPGLLLPQRSEEGGLARRRPADIFVPSYLGSPVAFDAVTGPQRQETLGEAARKSLAAAMSYADVKRSHLDTAQTCQAQGIRFLPLVAESTGAWEPEGAKVLQHISGAVAVREGAEASVLHSEIPSSCKSCASLPAASAPGRCSAGELSWPRWRVLTRPVRRLAPYSWPTEWSEAISAWMARKVPLQPIQFWPARQSHVIGSRATDEPLDSVLKV